MQFYPCAASRGTTEQKRIAHRANSAMMRERIAPPKVSRSPVNRLFYRLDFDSRVNSSPRQYDQVGVEALAKRMRVFESSGCRLKVN